MNELALKKKLNKMIVTVILLVIGLAVTSAALANSIVSVRNNRFSMSMGVTLEINDGNPMSDITNILYEPGGTYRSEFPISNLGTFDVWYRVYLTEVSGELEDEITVTIKEQDGIVLCQGKMSEINSNKVDVGTLAAGEEKVIIIEFHFAPTADNSMQNKTASFNITADATQKKNNPGQDFSD